MSYFSDLIKNMTITLASHIDIKNIFFLQKRAFVQEAERNEGNYEISPICQRLNVFSEEFCSFIYLKACIDDLIIGAIRAQQRDKTCFIGRLIVEPIFQKHGIGTRLLTAMENHFSSIHRFEIFTGENSIDNITFYKNRGYVVIDRFVEQSGVHLLKLEKRFHN